MSLLKLHDLEASLQIDENESFLISVMGPKIGTTLLLNFYNNTFYSLKFYGSVLGTCSRS